MAEVIVLEDQTLMDIALQVCGSIEALFDLATLNGLAITDEIAAGDVLVVPASTSSGSNKQIADYYKLKELRPATNIPPSTGSGGGEGGGGGIEDLLDDGIDFMAVGVDNVVM